MTTTSSDELALVVIGGSSVECSHAVLIETEQGWHVELEDVPLDSCPFVEEQCEIALHSWDGDQYAGSVTASYATEDATYLVLTGVGELRRSDSPADATSTG
jgi:hypothetical protein